MLPPGSCDTHVHFYHSGFPIAPSAVLTPDDATVADYRLLQERVGLERVVVVQPTTYGFDNSCQLQAMAQLGPRARGVMVVDSNVSEQQLARLHGLGVRGIRFHMLPGGALGWEKLEPLARRVSDFDWHIQLQLNGRELNARLARLQRLPVPLVVDHVGRFMPPVQPDDEPFAALLTLLDTGRCWVKLSAPYESSGQGPPSFEDVGVLARALVAHAPERMLWASNWPHPGQTSPPALGELLELLYSWVDNDCVRERILVDNPAQLYGF
ncbi:MAG: amidohydrolase [Gammaproteobacteria bacterium SG8_47]|nr:MAG: amidohydrolase [Gammaproteobacteria bacterium SG8_47]